MMDEFPLVSDGLPDGTTSARFCPKCGHDVEPIGKGRCPVHQIFLHNNSVARRHPVSVARRKALLAEVLAEFAPSNVVERATAEQLAAVMERLETLKPGSMEWQRLITAKSMLLAELQAARQTATSFPGIERIPLSSLELAHALTSRLAAGEQLTERELGQLDVLDAAMRAALVLPADPPGPRPPSPEPTGEAARRLTISNPAGPSYGPGLAPAARPEEGAGVDCPYCRRPCVGRDHHAYSTFHYSDPEEIKRRDREATAVMMRQLGKTSPYGDL